MDLVVVLCTGRTTQSEGCPGLFGRPGVSAFRIRKEGRWGKKRNRIRLLKTFVIYKYGTVLNVIG
jgi:hypothetical protein